MSPCYIKTNVSAVIYNKFRSFLASSTSADQLFRDGNFIVQHLYTLPKSPISGLTTRMPLMLDCPTNTPDLNPTETPRSIVMKKMRHKNNVNKLKVALKATMAYINTPAVPTG